MLDKVRIFFWPRMSISRSAKYIAKRVLRLTTTPHAVAAGFAAGAGVSFLPLMGFHFVLGAAVAFCLRGNILASAFGTAVGNPLTFPFIWGGTYALGRSLLSGNEPQSVGPLPLMDVFAKLDFSQMWQPLIKPMLVGGVPMGLVVGLAFYVAIRSAMTAAQKKRARRLTHSKVKSAS
jgi:uncharacterized protein (DUF2062 family)